MKTRKFILTSIVVVVSCLNVNAIEIKRYVAEGGMGDGLTKENPSGDLQAVLNLSRQVDGLTVYLEPGTYNLLPYDDANDRKKYNNVKIYGGGVTSVVMSEQKSVITGDLYINGGVVINVDFKGSRIGNKDMGYLEGAIAGGCNIFYSNATNIELTCFGGAYYLIGVNAATAYVSKYGHGNQGTSVTIKDCVFSRGHGLSVSGLKLNIENCSFKQNTKGLVINSCEGAVVERCDFIANYESGAVSVNDLTDDYAAIFDRCAFSSNVTAKSDVSSVLATRSPILMTNCLIAKNYSNLNRNDRRGFRQHKGAIELTRRQSRFVNCTFYKNSDAVIYYNMTPADHSRIKEQFLNCVFLENGSPFFSEEGNEPIMTYCAADFGSAIPELDAERNMVRIDTASAKMEVYLDKYVALGEDSRLINVGKTIVNNDLNGVNHYLLGGSDMGCVEYVGIWKKAEDGAMLNIGSKKYVKITTTYNGKNYYAMQLEEKCNENKIYPLNALYLGDMLAPLKVLDDENVIAYMTIDGDKMAVLYNYSGNLWDFVGVMPYTKILPTAEKNTNRWVLKEGKSVASAPQSKRRTTAVRRK